jgi:hypothetical protein
MDITLTSSQHLYSITLIISHLHITLFFESNKYNYKISNIQKQSSGLHFRNSSDCFVNSAQKFRCIYDKFQFNKIVKTLKLSITFIYYIDKE